MDAGNIEFRSIMQIDIGLFDLEWPWMTLKDFSEKMMSSASFWHVIWRHLISNYGTSSNRTEFLDLGNLIAVRMPYRVSKSVLWGSSNRGSKNWPLKKTRHCTWFFNFLWPKVHCINRKYSVKTGSSKKWLFNARANWKLTNKWRTNESIEFRAQRYQTHFSNSLFY